LKQLKAVLHLLTDGLPNDAAVTLLEHVIIINYNFAFFFWCYHCTYEEG